MECDGLAYKSGWIDILPWQMILDGMEESEYPEWCPFEYEAFAGDRGYLLVQQGTWDKN